MSFDLFVLHNGLKQSFQETWLKKLDQQGIVLRLDQDLAIESEGLNQIAFDLQLKPPLVKEPMSMAGFEFEFDSALIEPGVMADYKQQAAANGLMPQLEGMKYEVQFSSSAGREDVALILQCYLSATMADASGGMLSDPQEFGLVDGLQALTVAQHHCAHELRQLTAGQEPNTAQSRLATNQNEKQPMSGTLIFLLIVLFIALRNLLMDS